MAGVGAVALVEEQVVEEQAVVVFVSPVGRGGRPPGGAGHAERARQAIKDNRNAARREATKAKKETAEQNAAAMVVHVPAAAAAAASMPPGKAKRTPAQTPAAPAAALSAAPAPPQGRGRTRSRVDLEPDGAEAPSAGGRAGTKSLRSWRKTTTAERRRQSSCIRCIIIYNGIAPPHVAR